jgi:hypothetical protein
MNAAMKTLLNNLLFGMDCNIQFHINTPRGKIPEAQARIEKLHKLYQWL